MFLLLVSLAFSSSSLFTIPNDPKPTCDLNSRGQKVILIGELHGSDNSNEVFTNVERLAKDNKLHFLLEGSSLEGPRFLDNPVLRTYMQLNTLIHSYHETSDRLAANSWALVLFETQKIPQLLSANGLTAAEKEVLETLEIYRDNLSLTNHIKIMFDIESLMKDNDATLRSLAVKLLVHHSYVFMGMYSGEKPDKEFLDSTIPIDNIGYWDLYANFGLISEARELFMAQRIFDYACGAKDRQLPIVVRVGDSHLAAIKNHLERAMPTLQLESYSIVFRNYHVMDLLQNLDK
jgi:hypothetical protein